MEIVGSAVIENPAGEILMVQSPKWRDKWVMPGGHIEPGETIIQAIVREAEEEVGLKLQPVKIVSFGELINSPDFHRPGHFIFFDVWCKAQSLKVKLDGRELTAYRWASPSDALLLPLAQSYDQTIRDFVSEKSRADGNI